MLRESDYAAGCVIVAATLEGDREPTLRAVAADVFQAWEQTLAGALQEHGVPAARARSIATLTVSAVEGAIVLCRAQRSTAPLERVTEELQAVLREALG